MFLIYDYWWESNYISEENNLRWKNTIIEIMGLARNTSNGCPAMSAINERTFGNRLFGRPDDDDDGGKWLREVFTARKARSARVTAFVRCRRQRWWLALERVYVVGTVVRLSRVHAGKTERQTVHQHYNNFTNSLVADY